MRVFHVHTALSRAVCALLAPRQPEFKELFPWVIEKGLKNPASLRFILTGNRLLLPDHRLECPLFLPGIAADVCKRR